MLQLASENKSSMTDRLTNQRWNNHIKTQGAFHLPELAGMKEIGFFQKV